MGDLCYGMVLDWMFVYLMVIDGLYMGLLISEVDVLKVWFEGGGYFVFVFGLCGVLGDVVVVDILLSSICLV